LFEVQTFYDYEIGAVFYEEAFCEGVEGMETLGSRCAFAGRKGAVGAVREARPLHIKDPVAGDGSARIHA
jgi:hypothetical protein